MRTYNVHQVVEHVPRVVFADALHALREMLGSAAVQKAEDGVSQRVVHDGIQFAALEIAPTLGVRNFVGRILPHLTDDERIGFLPAGGSVQLLDEAVRSSSATSSRQPDAPSRSQRRTTLSSSSMM